MPDLEPGWISHLRRWCQAGLIDSDLAVSIEQWEQARVAALGPQHAGPLGLSVRVMVVLGSLLLVAGVLLFVAGSWDFMPPQGRIGLLLVGILVFHGGGALFEQRFPAMAIGLHAVGTAIFGAGVFLSAQIFNLEVDWSFRWGLLFWALGAASGWWFLRQWPQLVLLSILLPAWLTAVLALELRRADPQFMDWAVVPLTAGFLLLSLTYFTAPTRSTSTESQRVFMWIGGLLLLPAALTWVVVTSNLDPNLDVPHFWLSGLSWAVMLGVPLVVSWLMRPHRFSSLAVAVVWVALDLQIQDQFLGALSYLWWGLGAFGLMVWGAFEARDERVNVGTALFAITLLAFYVMQVMGRLGFLSLFGLGLIFLLGGWGLNRLRSALLCSAAGRRP